MSIMSAFRWAKLNNLPIRTKMEWLNCEDFPMHFKLGLYHYEGECAIYLDPISGEKGIVLEERKGTSNTLKEISIWHEIGHYVDSKNFGFEKYGMVDVLFKEARASEMAIKLMKEHGRWKESKRLVLLDFYESYEGTRCGKSHRHLIENA